MRVKRKGNRKLIRVTRGVEELEMRLLLSTSVTTYHNDNRSTGQNLNETVLTPANVNVSTFGKQFTTPVDGQIYAQPLYVSGVNITAGRFQGVHDVAYVATEHDSLYAIDAHGGNVLWKVSFIDPSTPGAALAGATSISTLSKDIYSNISPEIGITSTPVIDSFQHALFVVTETRQIVNGQIHYVAGLFKVDIRSGTVIASKVIADTVYSGGAYSYRTAASPTADQDPFVVGSGDGSITVGGQQRVYFNALWQTARPGIVLQDGRIYTTWASQVGTSLWHGWILGFDENTLATTAVFNTTPGGTGAGIWQGVTVAPDGNFYFETGNGTFDGKKDASGQTAGLDANGFPVNGNYGDAIVRIALDGGTDAGNQNINGWGLRVSDYFAHRPLSSGNLDLGIGGVVVLPDAVGSASHPHLLVGSSREGTIYLIDRDNMGKFDVKMDHVVQEQAEAIKDTHSTPALFNDGTNYHLYFVPDSPFNDHAKSFTITDGAFPTTYEWQSPDGYGNSPGSPSVSANGVSNGIVWTIDKESNQLRAYDATNLTRELWTSDQAAGGRDALGKTIVESVATVADGEVFVGISNALVAYGPPVIPTAGPAAPTELTAAPRNDQLINLGWQDNSNNEEYFSILRSTDGVSFSEVGRANANVQTYVDSNNVVGETRYYYKVEAHNNFGGGSDSPPSNTVQVMTPKAPVVGNGDGAAASYFNDVNGQHLTSPAALTRVDPQINFNWLESSPGAPVGADYFSARWTGRIKAQYNELYTFYTVSDDGVRLYIKPTTSSTYTTVIDDWTLHAAGEDAGTFMMSAGEYYDFKMEYFENFGGATAQLLWSSPSTVKAIIPQSQLYSGVTPAAPSSVVAKGGSGKVYLSWAATTGAERYSIYRSTTPGGEGAVPLAADITDPSYVDTTPAGATYYYKVTASNDGGESAASAESSAYSHIPADANDDRSVDFNDLVALAQNYNTTGKTFAQGDFTGDGSVDFNDLVVLAQHYNTSLAAPGGAVAGGKLALIAAAPVPSLASVIDALDEPAKPATKPAPEPHSTGPRPAPVTRVVTPVHKRVITSSPLPATPFATQPIKAVRKRSDLFD